MDVLPSAVRGWEPPELAGAHPPPISAEDKDRAIEPSAAATRPRHNASGGGIASFEYSWGAETMSGGYIRYGRDEGYVDLIVPEEDAAANRGRSKESETFSDDDANTARVTIAVAGNSTGRRECDDGAAVAQRKQGIPRTSSYHGVTRHRWTGKYEAHLWDGSINIESRKRKGKQVYLGGYDLEEKAARAYDLAALKYWGPNSDTKINFHISEYENELMEMNRMSQEEWVACLRRRSSCFSRGVSAYRGVTRRKKDGKWQARLGSVAGKRDIYLGAYNTEEEAAVAYDIAAVELKGSTAVTNFDINNYLDGELKQLPSSPDIKL